jgi:glycosyltransferase involved in cell wall biosynthesis
MNEALATKAFRKRIFLCMSERRLRKVTAFHATSEPERKAIGAIFPNARVAVIPNGVDVPQVQPKSNLSGSPYLLYLGRLHPYKRVDRIIGAFGLATEWVGAAQAKPADARGTSWTLIIAGDGEASHRQELERAAAKHGVADLVRFVGQVRGEEKAQWLAQAEGLVLASYSENFGMSVAEALAQGTPCVVARTAPWAGLERENCGYWVEDSLEALAAGMTRLMTQPHAERCAMGEKGRQWMRREFSWVAVAKQMIALYEELEKKKRDAGIGW